MQKALSFRVHNFLRIIQFYFGFLVLFCLFTSPLRCLQVVDTNQLLTRFVQMSVLSDAIVSIYYEGYQLAGALWDVYESMVTLQMPYMRELTTGMFLCTRLSFLFINDSRFFVFFSW